MKDTGCALEGLAMRSSEAATGTRTTMPACSISTTIGLTTTTTMSASADPILQHLDAGHAATEGSILVESIPQDSAKARQQAKPKTAAVPTGAVVESGRFLIPAITFEEIKLDEANDYLIKWGHKMGPLLRGNSSGIHYALMHEGRPVAVAMTSTLIRERVGGGLVHLTRENTCELSRLCAIRPGLCRVALRLWREFVLPNLGYQYAISYQDADLHNGNTYRFDGWERQAFSSSGTDSRSGRKGRRKWIWVWQVNNV